MKSNNELEALKTKYANMGEKLKELSPEQLKEIAGGNANVTLMWCSACGKKTMVVVKENGEWVPVICYNCGHRF